MDVIFSSHTTSEGPFYKDFTPTSGVLDILNMLTCKESMVYFITV